MSIQNSFDDLYSVVYGLIDEAKASRELVKLHKGSHGSGDPYFLARQAGSYLYRTAGGPFAFICDLMTGGDTAPWVDELDGFDALYRPRISMRTAFELLVKGARRPHESEQDYLSYLVGRRHELGAYRGGSSGYDDEARALAAAHFQQAGIDGAAPEEILICCGGAKGVFMAACAAVMCLHEGEAVHRMSGRMLAPAGYYQSLRVVPPVFGGEIDVVEELTGAAVAAWLTETAGLGGRVIYAPLVNNFDGSVLDEHRAHDIATVVLEHNRRRSQDPVYVLGDDVYVGSVLDAHRRPTPIGSVTGADLGIPELGAMSDWTLSVVTPSKTFALPTSRVAFAHTSNSALRAGAEHYRTMLSHGRVPQSDELTGIAAIAWTPQLWIDGWNATYARRMHWLREQLAAINGELGMEAFHLSPPEGGWYAALRTHPRLIGDSRVTSSVETLAICLHYGRGRRDSGLALLPGELSGYRVDARRPEFVLRLSVAVTEEELRRGVARLRELGTALCGPEAPQIVEHAVARARHHIPDLKTRVEHATT